MLQADAEWGSSMSRAWFFEGRRCGREMRTRDANTNEAPTRLDESSGWDLAGVSSRQDRTTAF
eukprot:5195005-Pleurochrysis_carterae.AAC.1